jgi:bifunctional DNA-binding transcriptional regulator/antitoxin component of YhaV-PrlF toxin-antitoxin module
MRITSKGQVTIPVEIREKGGFCPAPKLTSGWTGEAFGS